MQARSHEAKDTCQPGFRPGPPQSGSSWTNLAGGLRHFPGAVQDAAGLLLPLLLLCSLVGRICSLPYKAVIKRRRKKTPVPNPVPNTRLQTRKDERAGPAYLPIMKGG